MQTRDPDEERFLEGKSDFPAARPFPIVISSRINFLLFGIGYLWIT
jgi:hypothetical protein